MAESSFAVMACMSLYLNSFKKREDSTTDTELRAIAKPAHIGSS